MRVQYAEVGLVMATVRVETSLILSYAGKASLSLTGSVTRPGGSLSPDEKQPHEMV